MATRTWTMLQIIGILLGFTHVRWKMAHGQESEERCPVGCKCRGGTGELQPQVDCVGLNLTAIPAGLSNRTTHLDLSRNNISNFTPEAFHQFILLEELRLAENSLVTLPAGLFAGFSHLRILTLNKNLFEHVPWEALNDLPALEMLHLEQCELVDVHNNSFKGMNLAELWLDSNHLTRVPTGALTHAPTLHALTLASNQITAVEDRAFVNLSLLQILLLSDNLITTIGDRAFEGLTRVVTLEIHHNFLTEIPVALSNMPSLVDLKIVDNKIQYLPANSFSGNPHLTNIRLKNNPITQVHKQAFNNLPKLETLRLSEARDQEEFPDLTGTYSLISLSLDRGSIKTVPSDLCEKLRILKSIDIHSNQLTRVPNMSTCYELRTLNIGNNEITSLDGQLFAGMGMVQDLTLAHNYITEIPEDAFTGLTNLQYLDLQHNKIVWIHPDAFSELRALEDLNLGENLFSKMPSKGLTNLKNLKTFNNRALQDFPSPEVFPVITILRMAYSYHCCAFIENQEDEMMKGPELKEEITWLSKEYDDKYWRNLTNVWGKLENLSSGYQSFVDDVWDAFGTNYDFELSENIPASASHYFADYKPKYDAQDFFIPRPAIDCKPMPGPFMPCDDLMGWWSLRCGVWVVFLLALLGNGCVLFVSICSRSKMDVPRFLICNLACADFFMGVYLGFLAIVDASTLGEFKKHAIQWQTSPGCLVAGFLGVLSSELSVFTLTVITLERFYAITHAMHLNKRLSIRHAGYIMACGWFLAVLLASMPLFGVSDYRKFAICLPFEIGDVISLVYVCMILMINCLAFIIIVSCYMKMYCSIRGSQAWNSNDTRVAKRMALLVFTDFACWAPISFFSLTASFGYHLISLNDAKVFTIFVLPLNSCANPFLYAIFTKQFKKDCSAICRRLEESAMTRSLSRFSNRNLSLSWGSSRRPSALNSFFVDKRISRSNSVSGASAPQMDNNHDSTGRRSSKSSNQSALLKRSADERNQISRIPMMSRGLCSCMSSKSAATNMASYQGNLRMNGHPQQLMDNEDLRLGNRKAPVGAGQGFFARLKRMRGLDKLGDGMDSDQEDGLCPCRHQDHSRLGVFPLLPLGRSPGGARRPMEDSPERRIHNGRVRTNSETLQKTKSMTLSCCNGSQNETPNSPGLEYHLMQLGEDNSGDPTSSSSRRDESSTSDIDPHYMLAPNNNNNNHEYMNVTQDMISELQKIRESTSSVASSSNTEDEDRELETPDIRLDPEGSESKEKPNYAKLKSREPGTRGCQCKNPQCCERREQCSPSHIAQDNDTGTPTNRDSWILGTGRSLSPYPSVAHMPCNLQKSSSCDWDDRAQTTRTNGLASASLPLLSSLEDEDPEKQLCGTCACSRPPETQLAPVHNTTPTHGMLNSSTKKPCAIKTGSVSDPDILNDKDACPQPSALQHLRASSLHQIPSHVSHSSQPNSFTYPIAMGDGKEESSDSQKPFHTHVILDDCMPQVVLEGDNSEQTQVHI